MMIQAERQLGEVLRQTKTKFDQLLEHYKSADAAISAVADAVLRQPPPGQAPGMVLLRQLCGDSPLAQRLDKITEAGLFLNFSIAAWRKSSELLVKKYPGEGRLLLDPLAVLAEKTETAHEKIARNVLAKYNPMGTTIELNVYECNMILAFTPLIPELGTATVVVEPNCQVVEVLNTHFPNLFKDYTADRECTLPFGALVAAHLDMRQRLAEATEQLFGNSLPLKLY